MSYIQILRKQTRDLYVALNQLAGDALSFYAKHPEDLSARLLKELHSITNTVSRTLEKTPEVILDGSDRAAEVAKIDQEFELMIELDWAFLQQAECACSNPECSGVVPAYWDMCSSCKSPRPKLDRNAYERDMQEAKEERIRELDKRLRAIQLNADDVMTAEDFPDQESFGLAGQVRNLLTIVEAKLKEAKGKPMEALQSSMLREAVNILGSASTMVDRLEGIVATSGTPKTAPVSPRLSETKVSSEPRKPGRPRNPDKKERKPTDPKIEAKPLDFGDLKIRA